MRKYPDDFKEGVVTQVEQGMSVQTCSDQTGVPTKTIHQWVKARQNRQGTTMAKETQRDARPVKSLPEGMRYYNEDGTSWTSRDQDARENEEMRVDQEIDFDALFNPQQNLRAPKPRDGFVQRWVRMDIAREMDTANLTKQTQKGLWSPRHPDTVKGTEYSAFITQDGMIKMRGMVLMERPIWVHDKARAWKREQNASQMKRIEADLAESAKALGGMGIYVDPETKTTVSRGAPKVADD